MKFKSALLLIPLFSAAAQAGYVDYRHEYYDDGRNYDRVYMSHRFATGFGVAVEAISRSENTQSNDAWNNMESNGNEYTASYQFTRRVLSGSPALRSKRAIISRFISLISACSTTSTTTGGPRSAIVRSTCAETLTAKMTAWSIVRSPLGYNVNDWMFELNGIYKIADSEDLYNNRKDDYEYNFRVAYKLGSRVPFVEGWQRFLGL